MNLAQSSGNCGGVLAQIETMTWPTGVPQLALPISHLCAAFPAVAVRDFRTNELLKNSPQSQFRFFQPALDKGEVGGSSPPRPPFPIGPARTHGCCLRATPIRAFTLASVLLALLGRSLYFRREESVDARSLPGLPAHHQITSSPLYLRNSLSQVITGTSSASACAISMRSNGSR